MLLGFGSLETNVLGLLMDKKMVNSVQTDDECIVVMTDTLFYAEEGGQVCDTGIILTDVCQTTFRNYTFHHIE